MQLMMKEEVEKPGGAMSTSSKHERGLLGAEDRETITTGYGIILYNLMHIRRLPGGMSAIFLERRPGSEKERRRTRPLTYNNARLVVYMRTQRIMCRHARRD